jgi:polyferredoxin/Pyruvate/2-oxoacid:ferredoxin oxidoreductase delta subunit
MARARRIIQICFLIFFVVLFLRARYPYEVNLQSDLFLRFSPLIPIFYFIDNMKLAYFLWPALIILLLTPFIGRFFCGWICPLGSSLDVFHRIFRRRKESFRLKQTNWPWLKFGMLSALLLLAIFSINLWGYFDPLALLTRIFTVLLFPFTTLIVENSLLFAAKIPYLESVSYSIYDAFKYQIMPEDQVHLAGMVFILILAIIVFGSEYYSRRFWCRNICPAGAFLGLLSSFRFYERLVGEGCTLCNKCQRDCKMNAIPESDVKETNKVECIECFNCGEKCPPKAKSIVFRFRLRPYFSQPDLNRRQFIGSTLTGLTTIGLFGLVGETKTTEAKLIRPPGALPESEFLDHCIRCLECVRICASNGRCLQPAGLDQKLVILWTPVAIMRQGYCEYNCNLCGAVCPTDAILPLPLEVKQKTPMGIAYFDKNLCIPFVGNEDCIVCEEHCPTPDKAIKFELKEAILADGTTRLVKYPYIKRDLCIGCGICEEKCPLPGPPGVFIIKENEKRWESLPQNFS